MIQRKLEKGKTLKEIAEDLEEPLEHVQRICGIIERCGVRDAEEIYRNLQECTE